MDEIKYKIVVWDHSDGEPKIVFNEVMMASFWKRQKIIKEWRDLGYEVHSFEIK